MGDGKNAHHYTKSWTGADMRSPTMNPDALFSPWVAGADGYESGWIVVLWHLETREVRRRTVGAMDALLSLPESPTIIALDMIVGCPDTASPGGRPCDRAARQRLGPPRGTSVFSPPAYDALWADTYVEAVRRNRATGPDAPGLSKQVYCLFPKLREVATTITAARQQHVKETHPELSFYAMNREGPIDESKHTDAGREKRRALLADHGLPNVAVDCGTSAGLGIDDLLDAHAACWTARRIHHGNAQRCPPVPETPPRNARGLEMEIWG